MNRATTFHPMIEPQPFHKALVDLAASIAPQPFDLNNAIATFMPREDYDFVVSVLNAAEKAYLAGHREEAWFCLTVAAQSIGYQRGLDQEEFERSGEHVLEDQLRKHGSSGGLAASKSFDALRDRAAMAMLERKPPGGWRTKAAFDLAYHEIAAPILGKHNTEHQRKALLKRDDIRATLPRGMTRKR